MENDFLFWYAFMPLKIFLLCDVSVWCARAVAIDFVYVKVNVRIEEMTTYAWNILYI